MIFQVENCAESNLRKLPFQNFWVIVALMIKNAKPVSHNSKRILGNSPSSTQTRVKNSFVWG